MSTKPEEPEVNDHLSRDLQTVIERVVKIINTPEEEQTVWDRQILRTFGALCDLCDKRKYGTQRREERDTNSRVERVKEAMKGQW